MQSHCTSNGFGRDGLEKINQFALVSYIPGPLGSFLDRLRLQLVPECKPHAHVTILPPRPLCGEPDQAAREIRELSGDFEPFRIRLGDVRRFPVSDVIYIDIAAGVEELSAMYRALNTGVVSFCEKFAYSPHITLAQCLPPEQVDDVFEQSREAWRTFREDRSFRVEILSFVQNTVECKWIDLETIDLHEHVLDEHAALLASIRKGGVGQRRRA